MPATASRVPMALTRLQRALPVRATTEVAVPAAVWTRARLGDVVVGAAWPYQTINLQAAAASFAETIPTDGATGWGDTWMLATKAPHPNCAYLWTKWVSTPQVQADQAILFGETPVNTKACAKMEALQPHSCAQYHVDPPGSYFAGIKFWKTPMATCADGSKNCIPYSQWQTSWTAVTSS